MKVKLVLLIVAICVIHESRGGFLGTLASAATGVMGKMGGMLPIPSTDNFSCSRDVSKDFAKGAYDFALRLYKRVAFYNKDHFLISPLSMWLSLAAVAEGADGVYQKELFTSLNLPEERCLREKYYQIALSREQPGNDVHFLRKRQMVLDQGNRINASWAEYMKHTNLLEVSFAPIRLDPTAVAMQLKDFIGATSFPALGGNSVLVDSLDYEGMWTTAFPEARIERAPFYNEAGESIGMVDYMKIKKRVKLAHLPLIDAKVLDLPVGENGRYHMMIAVGLSKMGLRNAIELLVNTIIMDALSLFQQSMIPLEVAIPRFSLNFEYEASGVLDEIGAGSVFKQPEATWFISDPPAQPTNFYQRVAVKFDSAGIQPEGSDSVLGKLAPLGPQGPLGTLGATASGMATGLAAAIGRDFVANRPFMFGLFDTETNTCLVAGAFSHP